ncbi:hypothetical protein [Streptomyces lunaelactis]|uniref:hypothetical protein n=1 Tax=Streptomyces lunaelactis TaxID=1535768 RepID=UPI001585BCE3|nr:hypothetical protein [Streptomyces lunaelactis]NUK25384.1 hypothetical protein [Streptomyces lunaelactis]NUK59252.1 hypothetical protein [Streptomyces lunaelactis]
MSSFPGPRPTHGDVAQLTTDTTSVTITGSITSQGILREAGGSLSSPCQTPTRSSGATWSGLSGTSTSCTAAVRCSTHLRN